MANDLEKYFEEVEKKAELLLPKEKEEPQIKHNWLYSVVPLFPFADTFEPTTGGIYLAGYCKQCRNAFTVRLQETKTVGHVLIDKLDIPVYGCKDE